MLVFFYRLIRSFIYPSMFVYLTLILGLFLFLKKRKWGQRLVIFSIASYFLFSWAPFTNILIRGLESQYEKLEDQDIDKADQVVVLLGGELGSQLRANEALRLYFLKNQEGKIIISGRYFDDVNIGRMIKNYLIERGVNFEDIILEEESKNTFQHAIYLKEIVGDDSFFLVTSQYHMPRSMEVFEKAGLNPLAVPADSRISELTDFFDFLPNSYNLYSSDIAFHEYLGILFYRVYYFN